MVQVHQDEGVANRIDPESCAEAREGIGEALTGERIGQPLPPRSWVVPTISFSPALWIADHGARNASASSGPSSSSSMNRWRTDVLAGRRLVAAALAAFFICGSPREGPSQSQVPPHPTPPSQTPP